jgi:CelD/BcsL family acetyltransferase involved in cellulose biosynthesis
MDASAVTDHSLDFTPADRAAEARPALGATGLLPLADIDRAAWQALCAVRLEGNGFFDPGFSRPAFDLLQGGRALYARAAPGSARLAALLPIASAWQTLRLPLPVLVAKQPYSVLSTPLLDRANAVAAAGALLDAARAAGAAALLIPDLPLDGAAAAAITAALSRRGVTASIDNVRERAALDATADADTYLRAGMGPKKLKELRRQANRMGELAAIAFHETTTPETILAALDRFLALEASGWKGRRGTGLGQGAQDAAFIRAAAGDLGRRGLFSVLELWLGDTLVASGTIVRQGDHALFFKIAFDEAYARFSPGVQLTVELTRRLCADPGIRFVDSTADAGHPMIDHVWRERLRVGDLLIPTGRSAVLSNLAIRLVRARGKLRAELKSLFQSIRSLREKRL